MYNIGDTRRGYVRKQASVNDPALIDEQSVLIKDSFASDWIKVCLEIFP